MNHRPTSTCAEIIIAIFTGVILVAYGTSNYFLWQQWKIMSGQLAETQAGQRPYIGISEVNIKESRGGANIDAVLKNFGQIPAFNFSAKWTVFVNGKESPPDPKGPARPFAVYPGANQALQIALNPETWTPIAAGNTRFAFRVGTRYNGPSQQGIGHQQEYTDCEEREYVPTTKSFMIVGGCSTFP